MALRAHGPMGPWPYEPMALRAHGPTDPWPVWPIGPTGPWAQGAHGPKEPYILPNIVIVHFIYLSISLFLLISISILPSNFIRKLSLVIFIFSFIGIFLTLFIGVNSGGASRWLSAFGFTIQPSEFLKPSLIVIVSWFFARSRLEGDNNLQVVPLIITLIIISLLLLQPDVGQSILIILTIILLFNFTKYCLKLE